MAIRFIVDNNVGKLAKWLRMMGYDARFFNGDNDSRMVRTALDEGRVLLTRDTQVVKRRVVTTGQLRGILLASDNPEQQIRQVFEALELDCVRPFTICLECNQPLEERRREEVRELVPPYVFKTQSQFVQCPACHRIYWRGTHWQAMTRRLEGFSQG